MPIIKRKEVVDVPTRRLPRTIAPKSVATKCWDEVSPGLFVFTDEAWACQRAEAVSKPNPLLDDPEIKKLVEDIRVRYDLDDKA